MKLARRLQLFSSFFMMSHSKIAAGRKGAHRFKSAATTALVLSAMAGGVMLSGGQANAASICTPPGDADGNMIPGPAFCNVEDPSLSPFPQQTKATAISIGQLPTGTNLSYELTGLSYPKSQTQIDTDFNDPYTGTPFTTVYKVEGLNGTLINGVDLGGSCIEGACQVTKEIFSDAGLTNKVIPDLVFTGSPIFTKDLPPASTYYFRDTFNPNGAAIDNIQNTVRTPGPLPILGAGAAFGFSRKLRGRIKAARLG